MHAHADFLRPILERPGDDTPRLIYADYLEEHGDAAGRAHAEFIRVQCEMAATAKHPPATHPGHRQSPHLSYCERCRFLRSRERTLFAAHAPAWTKPLRSILGEDGLDHVASGTPPPPVLRYRWVCRWERGFPGDVALRMDDFLRYAAAIFAVAPVETVRLIDREPQDYHNNDETFQQGRLYGWLRRYEIQRAYDLPYELWAIVAEKDGCIVNGPWADFRTEAAAHAALSRAAVRWARCAAGLPDLFPEEPMS
jgi:uncharacterized protein (TIGR02996 family)